MSSDVHPKSSSLTAGDPAGIVPAARAEVAAVARDLPRLRGVE